MDNLEKCSECGCELSGLEEVCPKCGCLILRENTINVTLKTRQEKINVIKTKIKEICAKIFRKENLTKKNITIASGATLVLILVIVILVKVFGENDKMFTKVEAGMSITEVKSIIDGDGSTSVDLKNIAMILSYEDSEVIGIDGKTEYLFKDNGSNLYQIRFSFPYNEKNIKKMREYLDDEYGEGDSESREYKYKSDKVEYTFTNGETVTDQIVDITMK